MNKALKLTLFCLCFTTPAVAAQTLYRWVDEQGNVSFQDVPPRDHAFSEETIKTTSASPPQETGPAVEITFYAIADCEPCTLARNSLLESGLPFTEINPETDQAAAKQLVERFGKVEVPLTVVGETPIKGFNPQWLEAELAKAGVTSGEPVNDSTGPR